MQGARIAADVSDGGSDHLVAGADPGGVVRSHQGCRAGAERQSVPRSRVGRELVFEHLSDAISGPGDLVTIEHGAEQVLLRLFRPAPSFGGLTGQGGRPTQHGEICASLPAGRVSGLAGRVLV